MGNHSVEEHVHNTAGIRKSIQKGSKRVLQNEKLNDTCKRADAASQQAKKKKAVALPKFDAGAP